MKTKVFNKTFRFHKLQIKKIMQLDEIKQFGKEYYDNLIYVNFETNQELSDQITDNINASYIIHKLELFYGEKIIPGKTLIFFDEIQANERVLTSLKYFYENAPEYHIIAAGSLLRNCN